MTREKLFAAIERGRFEAIQSLAVEYRERVLEQLAAADPKARGASLAEALQPLQDALYLLRIIRAHHSAQYQSLAGDFAYVSRNPIRTWCSLNVDA